ncbi:hypothetical protein DMB44_08615 [Thermoplasma sp. Kam2015]|uniref:hypothetical protein n=1 Tax=Thermoplasma sp. Kam2015 TaxID=2094122 RepID=UPI000D97295E|nr:hypothetical protein [Thermoplasma sp. Kam2015]PYB67556.1 hypothetical protein DMB44_08615 [Thermoplasma sp. Kam2015]
MNATQIKTDTQYENNAVQAAYEWFIENLIAKIWNEPKWHKTAKGGEWKEASRDSWQKKYDLPYIGHILSGALCSLKVLDIFLQNESLNPELYNTIKTKVIQSTLTNGKQDTDDWTRQLEYKLRRSLFGYLFHDYVKITLDNYKMTDSKDNLAALVHEFFGKLQQELDISDQDLYQIAFSTEEDTKFNALNSNMNINPLLIFEESFSSLADKISSKFSDPSTFDIVRWANSLTFCKESIFRNFKLYKVNFSSTYFLAVTDLLKMELISRIKSAGAYYLWSTPDGIFYVADKPVSFDLDSISKSLVDIISTRLIKLEDGIEFTDRRINIPGRSFVPITSLTLKRIAENSNKIREALKSKNSNVDERDIIELEKYKKIICKEFAGDLTVNLTKRSDKPLNYRDILIVSDSISDVERVEHVLLVRIVQLVGSQVNTPEFKKVKEVLNYLTDKDGHESPVISAILRHTKEINRKKNPLLAPLLVILSDSGGKAAAETLGLEQEASTISARIDWEILADEAAQAISGNKENSVIMNHLKQIIATIINPLNVDIPKVPDKKEMSMIDGYPGRTEAIKENLYGLGTNAVFTNRIVTASIPNAFVDERYLIESFLRKSVSLEPERAGSVFVFLDFPGPIPFLDLHKILNYLKSNEEAREKWGSQLDEIYIALGNRNAIFRKDTSYFIPRKQPESTAEAVMLYQEVLNLAANTHLRVQVIDSHSPPALQQKEIFQFSINQFSLKDLGISRIRYNRIEEVQKFFQNISILADISRGSRKREEQREEQISEILREFSREPISLFSFCMDAVRASERQATSKGTEKSIVKKINYIKRSMEIYVSDGFGGVKGGVNMENLKKLAKIARDLWKPADNMSGSQRSWMLRESLDVLEKVLSEGKGDSVKLEEYTEFIEGHLYKGLEAERDKTDSKQRVVIDEENIKEFSKTLIEMISRDFNGRIPSGTMKSYLIDAFEFEYMFGN